MFFRKMFGEHQVNNSLGFTVVVADMELQIIHLLAKLSSIVYISREEIHYWETNVTGNIFLYTKTLLFHGKLL